MLLGKVVGTVVASQKDEKLEGMKLLVLQRLDIEGRPRTATSWRPMPSARVSARSSMYATGSSARQTTLTTNRPCDAVIMAIVDTWEIGGKVIFQKA